VLCVNIAARGGRMREARHAPGSLTSGAIRDFPLVWTWAACHNNGVSGPEHFAESLSRLPPSDDHNLSPQPPRKIVIGWAEYVDFVDWGIEGVRAKVDTGARTSALHVENLQILKEKQARFQVILSRTRVHRRVWVTAPVSKWARVRSSTGHFTVRCFVWTRVRLGPITKQIEISLISREDMAFRMLLGRQALEKDFIVDVSRRGLLGGKSGKREGSKSSP